MGINYGDFRNRSQDLHDLRGVILESIGNSNLNYEKFDYQETAILVNDQLDIVQKRYNKRFNYPPGKLV